MEGDRVLGELLSAEGGFGSFTRGRLALPIRLFPSALPRNDGDCNGGGGTFCEFLRYSTRVPSEDVTSKRGPRER